MKKRGSISETIILTMTRMYRLWILGALFVLLALQAGCVSMGGLASAIRETNVELRNAVDTFDRSIDALARQSSDWQVVLQDLEEALVDDVQSSLRVEVTNLLHTGILAAGGEFRCDAEFLRIRTERELRRIRNSLAQAVNSVGLTPPIPLLAEIPVEPFICSATPAAVDLSLDSKRRTMLDIYGFDLRSLPITAEVVNLSGRRNVTRALGIVSDLRMVLDLTDTGAALDENSRRIVLSWNQEPQSVIPILSPTPGPSCITRTELVTGSPQSFIPPHTVGDREYAGHGPCIRFSLYVRLDAEGKKLTANYSMNAYECSDDFNRPRSDYTTAYGTGMVELFRVTGPGERILGHNLASSMSSPYIDDDTRDDIFTFAGTNPVEKLIFVGDTSGDEAGTETGVTIYFREMEVQVETCTP